MSLVGRCGCCGEDLAPYTDSAYLWHVGQDEEVVFEVWYCGDCYADGIRWFFFEDPQRAEDHLGETEWDGE